MRRALTIALAGWFAIAITLVQSCAAPGQTGSPYGSLGPSGTVQPGASNSLGYSSNAPAAVPSSAPIDTTGYTADTTKSEALSAYLKHSRLPLVGAQVLNSPEGGHAVVLYGYVGSDFGKQDAVTKARRYLADSNLPIDNRIKVEPELLTAGNGGQTNAEKSADASGGPGSADEATAGSPDSQLPGISSYEQQQSQAQQYAQQQNMGATVGGVAPLLMLGLMALGMSSGGSSFAVGPGGFGSSSFGFGSSPFGMMGGPPFAATPYNPYPGFPSPPPVAPYGGAASPYTAAPPAPLVP
jgi:hypothetical protein